MRFCTSAVMKTVLPDRARPVTPSLTVGNTRSEAKSPRLRKASPRSWVYLESGTMASQRGGRGSGRVERGLQAQPCRDPPGRSRFFHGLARTLSYCLRGVVMSRVYRHLTLLALLAIAE